MARSPTDMSSAAPEKEAKDGFYLRALCLIGVVIRPGPRCRDVTETVDLIELNHFYDDLGRHAYDQVIFYEWSPDYRRFHVIAWCLVENDLSRMPTRNPKNGEYVVRWNDRDAKVHRVVRSALYRETWSK